MSIRTPFCRLEPPRPSVFQKAQPRRLALAADAFVEGECFGYGVVIGGRVRADLFELADVVVLLSARRPSAARVFRSSTCGRRENPVPCGASSHLCRLVP